MFTLFIVRSGEIIVSRRGQTTPGQDDDVGLPGAGGVVSPGGGGLGGQPRKHVLGLERRQGEVHR